jgi:simple sugar transport system ATP-binding protein
MRRLVNDGQLTVVLITHKFREVEQFAQDVTVLRAGRIAGHLDAAEATGSRLASMMFGMADVEKVSTVTARSNPPKGDLPYLAISNLQANGDRGTPALTGTNITVKPGEIIGVAGVSGNGQRELVEVLAGQRNASGGTVHVSGQPFTGKRSEIKRAAVSLLTEQPLANAAVRSLSIMENLALRQFDEPPLAKGGWILDRFALGSFAEALIRRYQIRAPSPSARLETLSGGNVQRVVLARELSRDVRLLIIQNPCFGLDTAAATEIRKQIVKARDEGAAVLLISEDLDEIMEISDRVLVMSGGRITYETNIENAEVYEIGRHMADAGQAADMP